MQINMPETGTFFFISDHCHVIENVSIPSFVCCSTWLMVAQWRDGIPQGWLSRDHPSWFRSTQRLKHLERITKGQVIPGHDKETFLMLQNQAKVFT
jgi:hypothetical protein